VEWLGFEYKGRMISVNQADSKRDPDYLIGGGQKAALADEI